LAETGRREGFELRAVDVADMSCHLRHLLLIFLSLEEWQ
jgi:hypothetical protein